MIVSNIRVGILKNSGYIVHNTWHNTHAYSKIAELKKKCKLSTIDVVVLQTSKLKNVHRIHRRLPIMAQIRRTRMLSMTRSCIVTGDKCKARELLSMWYMKADDTYHIEPSSIQYPQNRRHKLQSLYLPKWSNMAYITKSSYLPFSHLHPRFSKGAREGGSDQRTDDTKTAHPSWWGASRILMSRTGLTAFSRCTPRAHLVAII